MEQHKKTQIIATTGLRTPKLRPLSTDRPTNKQTPQIKLKLNMTSRSKPNMTKQNGAAAPEANVVWV